MKHQISELSAREDSTIVAVRKSRHKVEDALLARDQARMLKISRFKFVRLLRLIEARRKDGEEHVRKMEGAVQATKTKLQAQIAARDVEMQEMWRWKSQRHMYRR